MHAEVEDLSKLENDQIVEKAGLDFSGWKLLTEEWESMFISDYFESISIQDAQR